VDMISIHPSRSFFTQHSHRIGHLIQLSKPRGNRDMYQTPLNHPLIIRRRCHNLLNSRCPTQSDPHRAQLDIPYWSRGHSVDSTSILPRQLLCPNFCKRILHALCPRINSLCRRRSPRRSTDDIYYPRRIIQVW